MPTSSGLHSPIRATSASVAQTAAGGASTTCSARSSRAADDDDADDAGEGSRSEVTARSSPPDLGGVEHYSWVFSAYMLAATVTTPIYGRLSDVHGRRLFFICGIVLFMAGGIVGATSQSMTQLVIARGIQGLGAGALMPLAIATIGASAADLPRPGPP